MIHCAGLPIYRHAESRRGQHEHLLHKVMELCGSNKWYLPPLAMRHFWQKTRSSHRGTCSGELDLFFSVRVAKSRKHLHTPSNYYSLLALLLGLRAANYIENRPSFSSAIPKMGTRLTWKSLRFVEGFRSWSLTSWSIRSIGVRGLKKYSLL